MKMNKNEYQLTITAFEDLDSYVEVWRHGLDILKAFVDISHRVLVPFSTWNSSRISSFKPGLAEFENLTRAFGTCEIRCKSSYDPMCYCLLISFDLCSYCSRWRIHHWRHEVFRMICLVRGLKWFKEGDGRRKEERLPCYFEVFKFSISVKKRPT
jgi:hypothetical protein